MAEAVKPFVLLPPELLHGLYARLQDVEKRRGASSTAVMVACEAHLRAGDLAVVSAADRPAQSMLRTLRGEDAPPRPRQSSALDPEARMNACLGMALAQQAAGSGGIVLLFAGTASDLHNAGESVLRRCATLRLPLFFVTQTAAGDSTPTPVRATLPRLPRVAVDAHDTVAIYRVVQECSRQSRTGGGPTWLDCQTLGQAGKKAPGLPATALMRHYLEQRRLFNSAKIERAKSRLAKDQLNPEKRGTMIAL